MEPILFSNSWFITIFINALPFQTVLRIIDIYLEEGDMAIYRVALAVVKILEKTILPAESSLVVVMNAFSNLHTPEFQDSDFLIKTAYSFPIDEKKIQVNFQFLRFSAELKRNGMQNFGRKTL